MTDRPMPNPLGPCPTRERRGQRCPCCGGWPQRAAPIVDRYGWKWSLHTCHACGVQYQGHPMTAEASRMFYASGRYRAVCAAVTGLPWDDPAYLREAQAAYAARWAGRVDLAPGHWLDYGGSTGVVSGAWSTPDTRLTIADYGDGARVSPERALAVPDGTYDAILCCQTLDHLPQPLSTLEAFKRVAKPGARLFVDVVQIAHTAYKIDHTVYFPTSSAFLGLVERAGWSVLWLDALTHPTHYTILAESRA